MKQRRKVKESQRNGCGFGEIYRPSWPPYNTLTFLEKTLDLQNGSDSLPDGGIRLSMVDNIRTPLPDTLRSLGDNIRPVTMVDLSSSNMPDHIDLSKTGSRSPDCNPIILSGPESSRPSTPSTVVSPLPESTMRIPMPESMRLAIKIEDKDPNPPDRFSELVDPGIENELSRTDHAPHPSLYPASTATSPRPVYSAYSSHSNYSPPSISTNSIGSNPPISSASIVLSSYPITFPHSLPTANHSTPYMPPAKLRKRNTTKSDETQLGTILQDAVESLRTLTGSYREDTNDDVSGFLKMTGYQLRSIQDPIRRMRIMHAIQGLILTELSSSVTKNCSDKTTVQKFPDDMDSLELSV